MQKVKFGFNRVKQMVLYLTSVYQTPTKCTHLLSFIKYLHGLKEPEIITHCDPITGAIKSMILFTHTRQVFLNIEYLIEFEFDPV